MYLKYYGLREEPFGVTPDPRFLCATPTYQEAQATLEYGIRSGRGFTALIARPGMGKTTLLFHLLERYSKIARTAFIFLTQCDSREFMRYLMSELGTDTGETDFVRLQEQFGQLLVREAQAGKKVIAVVDEAQNLDITVLETVRLLSDFETPRAKLLHIILTGQPELADRLASPALLQLRQRISHLVRLEPLSAAEVDRYIDHRLRMAGYVGAPLFTPEARALILKRSEGIPRTINNLCFNALSLGCALQQRSIAADVVAEVSADLDFESIMRGRREEQAAAATLERASAASPATAPSLLTQEAENGEKFPVSSPAELPPAAATLAAEVHSQAAAAANFSQEEPVALPPVPGPVLLPDPSPPAVACQSEAVANAEVGNLALRIMPAETATRTSPTVPSNGSAPKSVTEAASAPANGSANPAAEKEKPAVDVEALAADCALFGMEEPKRWNRPVGRMPGGTNGGQAPRPVAPAAAAPRRVNHPRPAVMPIAAPAAAGPAKVATIKSATKAPAAVVSPGGRMPLQTAPGKLWPTRAAAAAINGRKRRRQRSLYLAAAASLLLLLMLIWLLGTSAPVTSASEGSAATENATPQADSASNDTSQAATGSNSSVLDVVGELPKPGEATARDTRPAVVMRGTRAGEQLLRRVDPVYPAAAQANRIQGPVVLEATIGTHGFLRHIRVVSGNPLLADSVLDAVRGWRYRPRMVGGRPTETETRIVVNFQLVTGTGNSKQNP